MDLQCWDGICLFDGMRAWRSGALACTDGRRMDPWAVHGHTVAAPKMGSASAKDTGDTGKHGNLIEDVMPAESLEVENLSFSCLFGVVVLL